MSKRRPVEPGPRPVEPAPPQPVGTAAQGSPSWLPWALILMACAFFGYVAIRIFTVPLTNDEWGSLITIYRAGFADLLTFKYVDAQNHFLSGLLSMISMAVLPMDEVLAIRVPSVLGFGLFLYASWRLVGMLRSPWLGTAAFVALVANAFQLDFFGLSRGYGLSIAFATCSLYGLAMRLQSASGSVPDTSGRYAQLAIWTAFLAVLCNLASLNFYAAVATVLALLPVAERRLNPFRGRDLGLFLNAITPILYNAALLATFYLPRLIQLIRADRLYFGGTDGFVSDTVRSLVRASCYGLPGGAGRDSMVAGIVVLLVAGCSCAGLWAWLRRPHGQRTGTPSLLCSFLLLAIAALSLVQHELMGVKFVIERAALILVPLFVMQVAFTADGMNRAWARGLGLGLLAIYAVLGIVNANLTHTLTWRETASNRELVRQLDAMHAATGRPVVLGMSDGSKYTTWYYAEKNLGLKEDPRTKDNGFVKQFGWLVVYSVDYGLPPGAPLHFLAETTHLYVRNSDEGRLASLPVRPLSDYGTAQCRLYERSGPAAAAPR